jgi:cell division control protein 6
MNIFDVSNDIFQSKGKSVFSKSFVPERILHRDSEIQQIASGISYLLNGGDAPNQIIYGMRGTGKTLIARHVTEQLIEKSNQKAETKNQVRVIHISLKNCRTEFSVAQAIQQKIGSKSIAGLGFHQGLHEIFKFVEQQMPEKYIIFILDEINEVKEPDVLLHSLLRYNEVYGEINKQIVYIFITNDSTFPYNLSPGTKSSFAAVTQRIFAPYNADQLKDILLERMQKGLKPAACSDEIIGLCAAYSAQELGDAREAIFMLEKAAEITVEKKGKKILFEYVTMARHQIKSESILSVLPTLPIQLKATALACLRDHKEGEKQKQRQHASVTGTAYKEYSRISKIIGIESLSIRRFGDFIDELETIGFIDAPVAFTSGKNTCGKTKIITPTIPTKSESILLSDDRFIQLRPILEQTTLDGSKLKK